MSVTELIPKLNGEKKELPLPEAGVITLKFYIDVPTCEYSQEFSYKEVGPQGRKFFSGQFNSESHKEAMIAKARKNAQDLGYQLVVEVNKKFHGDTIINESYRKI